MKKPSVNTRCVANGYAAANERIIEISAGNGNGGLVSLRLTDDGKIIMNVYRCDGLEIEAGPIYSKRRRITSKFALMEGK